MREYSALGLYRFGDHWLLIYPHPDVSKSDEMCKEVYQKTTDDIIDLLYDILNNVLTWDDNNYAIDITKVKK